jgi:hypothetical protein
MGDYDSLKKSVVHNLLKKYIKEQINKDIEIDPQIMDEYNHQEKFLKNSVITLKKRLDKEKTLHK